MRIFINPGHAPDGNPDPGACNPNSGLRECDVAKSVGEKAAAYLRAVGHEVIVLQSDSLEEIVDAANNWPADMLVSLHCNSASPQAHGIEIFTTPGPTAADQLATAIMNQASNTFPSLMVRADWSDGDVDKEARFYVIRYTDAPAVLFEMPFISNDEEAALMATDSFQETMAAAVARGVTDYGASI